MSLFQNHAGFCLTNKKFQLVEIDYRKENFYLENVDEEFFDETFDLEERELKLINILQNSYNRLAKRKPLDCRYVSFALHHDFFKIVELPYDNTLTHRDLIEHLNWELQLLFPSVLPANYVIQYIEVNKSNIRKDKIAIVIAVNKKFLNLIHKFCVKNNMVLKLADNIHLATNAFITLDNRSFKHEIYLSIMINEKDISVIVVDESTPIRFCVKKVEDERGIINILANEFKELLNFNLSTDMISKSYIYGDSVTDSLIEGINSTFNLSIIKMNPFDKIKISSHLYESENFTEKYNSFASAVGVALRLQ